MVLRHYLLMVKNAWWLVIVCILTAWSVSLGISINATPLYRASATFVISPNANLTSSRDMFTSLDTLDKRSIVSTYADILSSERILDTTIKQLNLNSANLKGYNRYVMLKPESNILELNVEGPDPSVCASLSNGIGQNGINFIKGIYQVFDINFLDQARIPEEPFSPQPLREGAIAAGIGLLAGIGLAIITESVKAPLEALRERAKIDRISKALTRNHFIQSLEREMARNQTDPISLGLLEMQGLRDIIDALPEALLSDLMHQVTARLRNQLRGNDLVGKWEKSVYAILLPATPGKAAKHTFERIRQALMEPISVESGAEKINIDPVIGLVSKSRDNQTAGEMIQHAEAALEKARQSDHKTVIYEEN